MKVEVTRLRLRYSSETEILSSRHWKRLTLMFGPIFFQALQRKLTHNSWKAVMFLVANDSGHKLRGKLKENS